jgi:hypothetical protein
MGDPETGLVECLYKGNKTSTVLLIGESFTVERQEIITTITRTDDNGFKVTSGKKAACNYVNIYSADAWGDLGVYFNATHNPLVNVVLV